MTVDLVGVTLTKLMAMLISGRCFFVFLFVFFSIKLSAMHSSGYTIAKANWVCTQIKQYKMKHKINIHLY